MSGHYVYSTLTNSQKYAIYENKVPDGQAPALLGSVFIKGGTNMSHGAFPHFETTRGVVTHITDEQLSQLEKNHDFQRHKKGGFIVVRPDNVDPEKVMGSGMEYADNSAPLTPQSAELNKPDTKDGPGLKISEDGGLVDKVKKAVGF